MVIPAKTSFAIKVKGENLQSFQNNFKCKFQFGPGDVRSIDASYNRVSDFFVHIGKASV